MKNTLLLISLLYSLNIFSETCTIKLIHFYPQNGTVSRIANFGRSQFTNQDRIYRYIIQTERKRKLGSWKDCYKWAASMANTYAQKKENEAKENKKEVFSDTYGRQLKSEKKWGGSFFRKRAYIPFVSWEYNDGFFDDSNGRVTQFSDPNNAELGDYAIDSRGFKIDP